MKFAKLFRHAMVSIALPFNTDTPRCLCILREAKLCSLLVFPGFPQCFIDAARISLKAFDRQTLVQNFFYPLFNFCTILYFQIRGVLNKLTPEKFDKLINEILSVDLSSTDILKGVIILVSNPR